MTSILKHFWPFSERKSKRPINYEFTEEDRQNGAMKTNYIKLQKKRLKMLNEELNNLEIQQRERQLEDQIERMKSKLYDRDDEDEDEDDFNGSVEDQIGQQLLLNLFGNMKRGGGNTPTSNTAQMPPPPAPPGRYDEEQLRQIKTRLPKPIKEYIKNTDEASLSRLIELIKGGE